MLVQLIKEITLPDGTHLPVGAVINLPDAVAAEYIKQGVVRERAMPGPTETKTLDPPTIIGPGSILSFQNDDNFVRDLVTVAEPWGGKANSQVSHKPRPFVAGDPILTLTEIKMHLKIEPEVTDEDTYLTGLETAAHRHTENVLRYVLAAEETPPNVKQAMLFLIAHWYRTREAVITGTIATSVPLAYMALLYPERDFTNGY